MTESATELGINVQNQGELGEIRSMYGKLEQECESTGLGRSWEEIKDCLKMVDVSMTKKNDEGEWVRKRRKNGDLDLSHPVSVALKTIEIARRHPDLVRLNDELVEAAVLHDFFEDFDRAVGVFNYRYPGGRVKATRVMSIALDVTKATDLDRRADESAVDYALRQQNYEKQMEDKGQKFAVKDLEDKALLDHVRKRAEAKDYRPLVIKIADRIHNMQTLDGLKPDAFDRTITQTRQEFIPLALNFGLITEAEELLKLCDDAVARRLNSAK